MKIEISDETVDNLVIDFLKREFLLLNKSIKEDDSLHPEDKEVYKKTRKGVKSLLRWVMVRSEANKWIEENK